MVAQFKQPYTTQYQGQQSQYHGSAFTLIEMLIVVAILMILIGLFMGTIGSLQQRARIVQTQSTISVVASGIASSAAATARNIATVEHPFAGTAAPRFTFRRSEAYGGADVPVAGDLIRGSDGTDDPSRLIRRDDIFTDPRAPQFVGMERWRLTILGSSAPWVTSWREGRSDGPLIKPELIRWIDEGFLSETVAADNTESLAWESSIERALSVVLGASLETLVDSGAIVYADPDRDPTRLGGRVRQDNSGESIGSGGSWEPGRVQEGSEWFAYRLRGASLIDAWGREILVSRSPTGGLRLESAGPSGAFVQDSDGRDATRDTIVVGVDE